MRALLLWAALALAAPTGESSPAIGRFLIAKPQVAGFFAESVIVLVDHADTGSLGLIVNRPIESTLAELVPELESARGHDEPAFLGGPVSTDQMILLVHSATPPRGAEAVVDSVFVSGSRDTLRSLLEKPKKDVELRAYVGYAGWAPGQLEAEIARGDWLVAQGDAASVFTRSPDALWRKLFDAHRTLEVRWHGGAVARAAKSINLSAPWRSAAASSDSPTSGRARSSTR
jgi:putative transcriptional regulator